MTTTRSDSLARSRDELLRRGLAGAELRAALSALYDGWLDRLLTRSDLSLAAAGSLGRREPAPYSDLDLVLLHDGRLGDVGAAAAALWYPIWDSGVGLDHAVRTPEQVLAVADSDLRAMLGLLDLRHVAGDAARTESVRERVRARWRAGAGRRVGQLRAMSDERARTAGDAAFLLEPDLKRSRGGLRDGQALRALALAQLVDLPVAARAAYATLLDVRGELHRARGRAEDVLRLQEQDGVGAALGLRAEPGERVADELLRRVNLAARTLGHALDAALRRAAPDGGPRRLARRTPGGRAGPDRVGLARDVVAQDGEVVLARAADPGADPGLVLRVARAAAEHGLAISPFTLRRLASAAPVPQPWPDGVRSDFLALLGHGRAAVPVLESLDLAGLLAPAIPEWQAVRGKAQHHPAHRFTVDRHLLETAAHAAEHAAGLPRPDLLVLGALLHDIGKGFPGDHSLVGARVAAEIARRMGLAPDDVATVAAMVRHHLLLPDTATRRDLDDPATLRIVAGAVGGSGELLGLLDRLAVADAAATGPAAWSEWKAGLVAGLVDRVRASLGGSPPPGAPTLDERERRLAEGGELAVLVEGDQVVVAAPDRIGALYRTAGVLALRLLNVRAATVRAHAGLLVSTFVVEPRFGRAPSAEELLPELRRVLGGDPGLAGRLRAKERAYARGPAPVRASPSVHWFDGEASGATVIEYRGADAIGLLCRVAAALERCQLDVRSAKVASLAGAVVDAFYVTTRDGAPVPPDRRPDVEAELLRA